jgi:hypothetical protein
MQAKADKATECPFSVNSSGTQHVHMALFSVMVTASWPPTGLPSTVTVR